MSCLEAEQICYVYVIVDGQSRLRDGIFRWAFLIDARVLGILQHSLLGYTEILLEL